MSQHRPHIQRVGDALHQRRLTVNNSHVIALARQMACNTKTYLSGPTNNDLHAVKSFAFNQAWLLA